MNDVCVIEHQPAAPQVPAARCQDGTLLPLRQVGAPIAHGPHELFAQLCVEHSYAESYRRAIFTGESQQTVWVAAHKLANLPHVKRRIAELKNAAANETVINAAKLAADLHEMANADPHELMHRGCCRYCHGENFRYQWIDEDELINAIIKATECGQRAPDERGGVGYNGARYPNAGCPQCFGSGDHWHVADMSSVSRGARMLFKGVNRWGEVQLHDQLAARAQLNKMLGFDDEEVRKIAAAAAGGAAGAAVSTRLGDRVASATTQEEAAQAYLQMIRGT